MTTLRAVPDIQTATEKPRPVGVVLLDAGVPRQYITPATEAFRTWLAARRDETRYPIHAGAVDPQTEQARRWAVALEQENAALIRAASMALSWLDEAYCTCGDHFCIRHEVEAVLRAAMPGAVS